jgi:hypothetical protein
VVAHAQLAADLDLAQRPGDEGADRTDGDDLPQPAFAQRRQPRPYFRSGGAMLICQRFQVGPCDAPQTISSVPTVAEEQVVTPKNPT